MPNKDKNIPKRRFKAFENADAWELRKLGEVANFSKGNGYSKKDLVEEGSPIILYGRLYTRYETVISEIDTFVSDEENRSNTVFSEGGEVLVPASGESALDIARASVVSEKGIVLGGDLNIIRLISEISPIFLALTISNGKTQKELSKRAQGKSVVHLHNSDLKEVEFMVPTLPEQTAIGTFFSTLDQQITLHQRKLDKLKNVKQAYLSEMFPAEGERVPKRRFPGFTDAWELRKLGELGTVAMCRRIFKEQTSEIGEIPFYKIGTFGGTPDAFISKELFEEYRNKYSYPTKGDILISASGSIGRTVEFLGKDEYFQDSNIVWLKHDGKIDNIFLKQFYSIVKWSGVEGSTIKRLYNENILNTEIVLPTLPEQKAIGTFFSTLDQQITLHQRKLEKLKNLKKALLNELFV
ncbi:TPA: restriction endonuclease subunit S [Streptococcus suis]|nr:restriction endonuclease subunit S [Streptococcus suis]